MDRRLTIGAAYAACLCFAFVLNAPGEPSLKETGMTSQAHGKFEVRLSPLAPQDGAEDSPIGRMSIDKTFAGDLTGSSVGEMLAVRTATPGSAGYVAMEVVEGTLRGRKGTFVLQHSSTLRRGEPRQSVTVIPDSGTGELEGLAGEMVIEITEGEHLYHFDYTLPPLSTD